jgi:hypothetical protein
MNHLPFIILNFGIQINFPLFLLVFSLKNTVYTFLLKISHSSIISYDSIHTDKSPIFTSYNMTNTSMHSADMLTVNMFKVTQNKELFLFFALSAIFGLLCLILMKYNQERFSFLEDVSVDDIYHGNVERALFNTYVASNICFWLSTWFFYKLFLVLLLCKNQMTVSREIITSDVVDFRTFTLWATLYTCTEVKTLLKGSSFFFFFLVFFFTMARVWILHTVEHWNLKLFFILIVFAIECLNIFGHIGDELSSLMTLMNCRTLYVCVIGWLIIMMYSLEMK